MTCSFGHQAVAQSSAPLTQNPIGDKSRGYELSGTVVSSVTGDPIPRALVVLSDGADSYGSHRVVLADNAGHFTFDGLDQGEVSVFAAKPGFFNVRSFGRSAARVRIGPNTSPILVKLLPEAAILGRVSDADGEGVEGIPVRVILVRTINGSKRWTVHASTETDEDGEFRVAHLPAGSFYVAAGPSSQYTLSVAGVANAREEIYPQVFYPGASELASASPIDLTSGQQFEADFTLTPEPVFQVSGTIDGYPGERVENLQLTKGSEDSPTFGVQLDPQSGIFRAKVPAGIYRLRGTTQAGTWLPVDDAPLAVNSDTAGIHITLAPALSIPVNVRLESAQSPSSQVRNTNGINVLPARISLASALGPLQPRRYWASPGPDGSLAIHGVDPGMYTLSIADSPQWWVLSATCGDRDLLREDLPIVAGAQALPIEIVLRDDVAALTGTVSLSEPRSAASVLLVPQGGFRIEVKLLVVSPQGQFQFHGLAPGDYRALAFDSMEGLEYTDLETLQPYLDKAFLIRLQSNQTANVNLRLIQRGP